MLHTMPSYILQLDSHVGLHLELHDCCIPHLFSDQDCGGVSHSQSGGLKGWRGGWQSKQGGQELSRAHGSGAVGNPIKRFLLPRQSLPLISAAIAVPQVADLSFLPNVKG